jgi:hypothetical protein
MRPSVVMGLVGALFLTISSVSANAALATRTWVSGVGNNANNALSPPCPRTAPCATFQVALSATTAGGEIDVLDPGDFGPVIIDKSISIYNDDVGEAGVTVSGTTNGIVIQAGTGGVVNLRGLVINGQNSTADGILIDSALRVTIQNCVIQQFGPGWAGIAAQEPNSMTLKIQDTTIINNGIGVSLGNGSTLYASIDRSRIDNNSGDGIWADDYSGSAILLGLSDSSVSLNGGNGVVASGPGKTKVNALRDVFVTNGGYGIKLDQTNGGNATALVGSSMFADDLGGAVGSVAGGSVLTVGNNQVSGSLGSGFTGTYTLF